MHGSSRRTRSSRHQTSGAERVFEDSGSRLWSAGLATTPQSVEAVLFTCISEPREAHRALSVSAEFNLLDVTPEDLRTMLSTAPHVGAV